MAHSFRSSSKSQSWWTRLLRNPWRDRVDWRYGADTGGMVRFDELDVASPNTVHATIYRATLGWVIRLFLRRLPIDHRRFTFIDLGSGKGRALLVATEFSFPSVIGVEFSDALHETALRNIAHLREAKRHRVHAVLGDVAEYVLPPGDLVVFLYNPFGPAILEGVIAQLAARGKAGHAVFVIYINPIFRDMFERHGLFETVFEHQKGVIYRCRSAAD